MASGAVYLVAVKLTRGGSIHLASEWLAGVLPNLVCGAVIPLAAFLSRKSLRVRDFLWMTLFSSLGLCAYEFAQIWMPRRTFDWDDVLATIAGTILALMLGAIFFVATCDKTADPAAAPDTGRDQ